jgi:hypothetical protein
LSLEALRKLNQALPWVVHTYQQNAAIRKMGLGRARVIAVMAFAGEDPDRVTGPGQFEDAFRQEPAHLLNDLVLGLAGGPSGLFPLAHLLN